MARRAPPLDALEAFVAVGRGGGIRASADTLCLSPSAVSRRIAALENFLGRRLFDRTESGLRLNIEGRRYLDLVTPAMQTLCIASDTLDGDEDRIVVATSHSVATRWLMPRIAAFQQDEGATLDIVPTRDPDVLRSGEAHFGLWGAMVLADIPGETLVHARGRPVSLPRLSDGREPPRTPDALPDFPLLAVRQPAGMWRRWLAAAGIERAPDNVVEFATMGLMYEAALAGIGIALAVPLLCEPQLRSGLLIACGPALPLGERYELFRSNGRASRSPRATRFVHWLRRETARSDALFDTAALAA